MLKASFISQAAFLLKSIQNLDSQLSIFVTLSDNESKLLKQELLILNPNMDVHIFPSKEVLPYDLFSTPSSIRQQRISILRKRKEISGILLCPLNVLTELFPPKSFLDATKKIKVNQNLSILDVKKSLDALGYNYVDKVAATNEYASRGGILDFFSQGHSLPTRIEFFNDEVESIRLFDPISQISVKHVDEVGVFDGEDVPVLDKNISYFINSWRKNFDKYDERECEVFQKYINKVLAEGYENYLPLFFEDKLTSWFDLFDKNQIFLNEEISNPMLNDCYNQIFLNYTSIQDHKFPRLEPEYLYFSGKDLGDKLNQLPRIKSNIPIKSFQGKSWDEILLNLNLAKDIQLITATISSVDDNSINLLNLSSFRPIWDFDTKKIYLHREFLTSQTYIDNKSNSDNLIFSNKVDIEEVKFQDGQLLIHEDYGLGVSQGLDILNLNSHSEECLKILFADDEILYLPLRSLYKISAYPDRNVKEVILDSLSSKKFIQKKESIKRDIYDSAVYFLQTQAKRSLAIAHRLVLPKEEYGKFNDTFPYELTKDQTICIEQIVKDLNLLKPMDRVICGDVGFGKTELAMRAAFISSFNSKQTLLAVPSTILCDQHFESFVERFVDFPVRIAALSRRKTEKEKNQIITDFNDFKIDILIGTHALFNEDINLSNTALLILDEEHRFGAKQKDLIKSKCERLHILSMSATPIPRTMNQVFSGLKDFSYLYTPPNNRLSVHTYKHIESSDVLKIAISREISRSGQIFVVQNNILKHDQLKKYLLTLMPDLSIASAHGKLKNSEIKATMQAFKNGSVDVLICTTIVEMGIDIPNANTMIVLDSHKFGLAQLHQLRGRIGRSTKQGYCYYLTPTDETTNNSKLRLDSLLNHSALGSGYFIAQEDLEIRGAGELLGEKQSGHINSLGMSLYLSLLKDAVKTINNKHETYNPILIELDFNDHSLIPKDFMPSPSERLKFYQRLNQAKNLEDLEKIETAMKDIGGKLPLDIENLLEDHKLKLILVELGIHKVTTAVKNIHIKFDKNISDMIYNKLLSKDLRDKFSLKYLEDNKVSIYYGDEARSQFKSFIACLS
ncbi:MAG: helicase-related protein [Gammaproteobacteria bacterium]